MQCLILEIGIGKVRCLMGKLNKLDIIKWTAIIIVIVLLFYIGRTKTVEDYERGMDSQSSTLERYKNE
jgi:hypothetical protein